MVLNLMNHNGDTVDAHQLRAELGPHVACADLDHSTAGDDTGCQFFGEQLSDPADWKYPSKVFEKLLMPSDYVAILIRGTNGEFPQVEGKKWKLGFELWQDCVKLYGLQKSMIGKSDNEIDIHDPVVNEFALKMLLLDHLIVMDFEAVWGKFFEDGNALMRYRLLLNRDLKHLQGIVKRLMQRRGDKLEDKVVLEIHSENRAYGVTVTQDDIEAVFGEPVFSELDRVVRLVDTTRDLLFHCVTDGIPTTIISGNVQAIAHGVIADSGLSFLRAQQLAQGARHVYGSLLEQREDGRLGSRLKGGFLYGHRKASVAATFARAHGRAKLVVVGDSDRGDGAMIESALESGGLAFIKVRGSAELTHKTFAERVERVPAMKGVPPAAERTLYIP